METAARQRDFCETLAALGAMTSNQDGWDAAARHLYQRILLPGHPAFWSAVLRAVARRAPPTAALLLECAAQSETDRLAVELVATGSSATTAPSARTTMLQVAMPIPKSERIAAYNANVKPVFRDLHGGIRECQGESPPDPDTAVYELDVRVRRTANGQQPFREMTQVALGGRYDTVFRRLVVPVLDRLVLTATQQYKSSSAASVSQDSAREAADTQTSEIVRGWAAHVFHQHAPPASADPAMQARWKRVFGDRCARPTPSSTTTVACDRVRSTGRTRRRSSSIGRSARSRASQPGPPLDQANLAGFRPATMVRTPAHHDAQPVNQRRTSKREEGDPGPDRRCELAGRRAIGSLVPGRSRTRAAASVKLLRAQDRPALSWEPCHPAAQRRNQRDAQPSRPVASRHRPR